MKEADAQNRERVKLWDASYARKREEQIELAHRKSGFTGWTTRCVQTEVIINLV